ncbi:MAG: hypothetical protein Q7T54_05120 [Candidatus Levybacteria bacterium]|nr:hypothetical protein [Candidatus Levybacteria bacterium]
MHKLLIIILSFFAILLIPSTIFAQTDTTTIVAEEATVTPTVKTLRTTRAEAKDAMKDKISQARDEFKERLATIKDQRKLNILTNLDRKFGEINKNRTTQMGERVARLTTILTTISTKGATLKEEGKNTTTLDANIKSAQTALDSAKTAIDTQAAKDYIINVTTETALKNAASTIVQQFITDMKAVHKTVVDAQAAVRKAHTELAKLSGDASATPTVTTTP